MLVQMRVQKLITITWRNDHKLSLYTVEEENARMTTLSEVVPERYHFHRTRDHHLTRLLIRGQVLDLLQCVNLRCLTLSVHEQLSYL